MRAVRLFVLSLVFSSTASHSQIVNSEGGFVFESHCEAMAQWEILDFGGDGRCVLETDTSVPFGFGSRVLRLRGNELVVLAKDAFLEEGTVVVLWKDDEPLSNDSDGVLLFQGEYSDDLATEYNLKQNRPHYFVEQDADAGFQIKYHPGDSDKIYLVKAQNGVGLTQGEWNRTGWIWQKITIRDGLLKAKFWSAAKPEPADWNLELPDWKAKRGRVGLQVWSGYASVAYFAASESDIRVAPPTVGLHALRSRYPVSQSPEFLLFFNVQKEIRDAVITLKTGDKSRKLTKSISRGYSEIQIGSGPNKPQFPLPTDITEGAMEFNVSIAKEDGEAVATVSRTVEFVSDAAHRRRLKTIETQAKEKKQTAEPKQSDAIRASSALSLLEITREHLSQGDFESLERSLDYAEQLLVPKTEIVDFTCENIHLSAASMTPGETYTLSATWRCLRDSIPTDNLLARLTITDELFAETPIAVQKEIAPGEWKNSTVNTVFSFQIPEEFPAGSVTPINRPPFREGFHRLWLSLHPVDENDHEWLDLPHPARGDFGTYHQVGRAYISLIPVEIKELNWNSEKHMVRASIRNGHKSTTEISAILRITTLSGNVILEKSHSTSMKPNQTSEFSFSADRLNWFGPLLIQLDVYDEQGLFTTAETEIDIPSPAGLEFDISRKNTVVKRSGEYATVLQISATSERNKVFAKSIHIDIFNQEGIELASTELNLPRKEPQEVQVQPGLGKYTVVLSVPTEHHEFYRREFPVLAPVFEIRDGKIYLNGETFIVKGINCHGLIPQSPRRTRQIMNILKKVGFNMLRGDYPPPWQIDMAVEENLGWMVLAPFSVCTTDELKERHAPYPFARMCEISRRFIEVYRDLPGTWFWNSCNEVTADIDELLAALYPIYTDIDPYRRPVVYANLFGQERTANQDIMGVNYYFGPPNTSKDRQPLIEKSIGEANKADIPCIYTECNTYYGPVYSLGKAAVEDLYEFGVEKGMSGGFLYQLREDQDRHPGVISGDSTLWLNPTFITSLRRAFADATVEIDSKQEQEIGIKVINKRPYSLRECKYTIYSQGSQIAEGQLNDFEPYGERNIPLKEKRSDSAVYEIVFDFETHYGIQSHLQMEVFHGREAIIYK